MVNQVNSLDSISQAFNSETKILRVRENIAYRAVCLITTPYHYVKMIAEVACGFFLGIAAILFACQSTFLNQLSIGMFRRSGDSFTKIGINVCGVFAPNWAMKQAMSVNYKFIVSNSAAILV